MENTNVLFDRKRLVRLIVPLIVEQVLAVTVGMADMVMVSGAGETAVSGISLVNTICVLLIVILHRWQAAVPLSEHSSSEAGIRKQRVTQPNSSL